MAVRLGRTSASQRTFLVGRQILVRHQKTCSGCSAPATPLRVYNQRSYCCLRTAVTLGKKLQAARSVRAEVSRQQPKVKGSSNASDMCMLSQPSQTGEHF